MRVTTSLGSAANAKTVRALRLLVNFPRPSRKNESGMPTDSIFFFFFLNVKTLDVLRSVSFSAVCLSFSPPCIRAVPVNHCGDVLLFSLLYVTTRPMRNKSSSQRLPGWNHNWKSPNCYSPISSIQHDRINLKCGVSCLNFEGFTLWSNEK